MSRPEELMARLARELVWALGDGLLSLAVHGSWALGDFAPGRSDVDLLAVLKADPDPRTLDRLLGVHRRLEVDYEDWAGHVEVDYVSAAAVRALVGGAEAAHPMIRISPGESLHLLPASRHYILNWAGAVQADRPVVGASPTAVLPVIAPAVVAEVLLDHVRAWPQWVRDTEGSTGAQAYAVLTLCRGAVSLATGQQTSKRRAAVVGASLFPDWAPLIGWASRWWYEDGSQAEPGRFEQVRRFVDEVSRQLLLQHGA